VGQHAEVPRQEQHRQVRSIVEAAVSSSTPERSTKSSITASPGQKNCGDLLEGQQAGVPRLKQKRGKTAS